LHLTRKFYTLKINFVIYLKKKNKTKKNTILQIGKICYNKLRNKTLTTIGLLVVGSCIFAGIFGTIAPKYPVVILFIIGFYVAKYALIAIYDPLIEKYLSNFTNEEIDTKIFTANNFLKGIAGAISGILAAFLLDRMETAYCMIIVGVIFGSLMIAVNRFMKARVGLKPEEYSKEEVKYDKIKEMA